ncbi:MAG: arsenate reductase ArsC [Bacteroidales bacterium]|uniref:arsenate reductase ArsC n=1 Tax=Porphyromonas sp. TaxID=1924944 RepID=UPI002971E1E7|nr:arsenate reductase ArsC [Porphyromonas sp.]MDD7438619.1 arsenate reductase ArsC [Bacteroidales bacterium]MDY3067875.1 arsenate reductase ArsC [Porphyromonas sp.]
MKVLILCTGNSCRSQMAHGFLQSFDHRLEVYSAGTEPALVVNSLAVKVMRELGVDISAHTPTHVHQYLTEEWDYVITVCGEANESCPTFDGVVLNRLHLGFDDPSKFHGSHEYVMAEFYRVRDEIKHRFRALYEEEILPNIR